MTTQIKRRRGTTVEHASFTGAEGEITIDTTKDTVVVHDGSTAGGHPLAKESGSTFTNVDINSGTIDGTVIGGTTPAAVTGTTGTFSGNLTVDTNTLYVDAANNRVGVGTLTPDTTVEIVGADPILTIRDVDTSTSTANATIRFAESGASDTLGEYWDVGLSPISALTFSRMGTEHVRIANTGYVGIGTSSPAAPLDVVGGILSQGRLQIGATAPDLLFSASGGAVDSRIYNDGLGNFIFGHGVNSATPTERLRIDSSGNVGIGTSTINNPFSVATAVQIGSTSAAGSLLTLAGSGRGTIYFADAADAYAGYIDYQHVDNSLRIGTATSERLRIDSSGNVGIGTSSPTVNLTFGATSSVVGLDTSDGADNKRLQLTGGGAAGTSRAAHINLYGNEYSFNAGDLHLFPGVSGQIELFTGSGSQAMIINSSGNVGIGTSSPDEALEIVGDLHVGSGTDFGILHLGDTVDQTKIIGRGSAHATLPNTLDFQNAGGLAMRIDSSGNLLVGTTTANGALTVQSNSGSYTIYSTAHPTNGYNMACRGTTTTGVAIRFLNSSGGDVGSIDYTGSATSYTTSSDYRLKEDVQPMTGASDRVLALNPVNFAWKADGSRTDGFIAHEVQEVAPYAVTGEKDGEDMQAMDHSKLVPLLTAALQEALTKIATLEARVAALEA